MKRIFAILILTAGALSAGAATVVLTTDGTSTGDSLDGIGTTPTAVSVVEIPGLTLTFSTALEDHTLNANAGDFGVDSLFSGEVNDRFDHGETVFMSFDKDVGITKLDFSDFDSGETFNFIIGSVTNAVAHADLSNKTSDYIENFTWTVSAGETIRLEVDGVGDSLSLDSLDMTIIPEPATVGLLVLAGLMAGVIRRIRAWRV